MTVNRGYDRYDLNQPGTTIPCQFPSTFAQPRKATGEWKLTQN